MAEDGRRIPSALRCFGDPPVPRASKFKKTVVLLTAVLIGANDLAELIDFIEIGDEMRTLEIYAA